MSKARSKGTAGENFFLAHLRGMFGNHVERAPLKGTLDYGDFVNVPWLHESKSTLKPMFQQWARTAEKKAGTKPWVVMWKGDMRATNGNGPYVLMPLQLYTSIWRAGLEAETLLRGSQSHTGALDARVDL